MSNNNYSFINSLQTNINQNNNLPTISAPLNPHAPV